MSPLDIFVAVSIVLIPGFVIWVFKTSPKAKRDAAEMTYLGLLGAAVVILAAAKFREDWAPTLDPLWLGLLIVLWAGSIVAVVVRKNRKGILAYLLAWLLPGLGHLYLGKRGKAVFFLGALMGLYLVGLWISNFRMVGFDDNPYYYVGQFGSGITLLFGQLLDYEKAFPREGFPLLWFDPGLLYVATAGLLNWVVALNVFEVPPPSGEAESVEAKVEAPASKEEGEES